MSEDEKPQKVIVDVPGTIAHTIGTAVGTAFGVSIMLCFIGLLVAPYFAPLIESDLCKKYRLEGGWPDWSIIDRQMIIAKIILWLIAIAAWALLIGLNLNEKSIAETL